MYAPGSAINGCKETGSANSTDDMAKLFGTVIGAYERANVHWLAVRAAHLQRAGRSRAPQSTSSADASAGTDRGKRAINQDPGANDITLLTRWVQ